MVLMRGDAAADIHCMATRPKAVSDITTDLITVHMIAVHVLHSLQLCVSLSPYAF